MPVKEYTNRLINEKSPYLLQHAHNPVDWFPWGDEAFEKAKAEDKPVFLSIGYSTCHWCHVMERESFEDEEVAAILNKGFISIKVDKEERPDVDAFYMDACLALNGSGGWPLSCFLTHDRKPFFAGTYFPKNDSSYGVGFTSVLEQIHEMWKNKRQDILKSADSIALHLKRQGNTSKLKPDRAQFAFKQLESQFDKQYGGFGAAPKFPSLQNMLFLIRYGMAHNEQQAFDMVRKTLDCMAEGGINDHIGGGFCRYSTDRIWLVPHFEKMMYDNAMHIIVYSEAAALLDRRYADIALDTTRFCLREMLDEAGGFYTATDADSEGVEGKFYVFTPDEIKNILGEEDGKRYCELYHITKQGNFEGKSIPNLIGSGISERDAEFAKKCSESILQFRNKRIPPFKDDKVTTMVNGLMTAALALEGRILKDSGCINTAVRCASFMLSELVKDGRLMSGWRSGVSTIPASSDDYASMIWGLIELYEATFDPKWLKHAVGFTEKMNELFWDNQEFGYYLSGSDVNDLPVRQKIIYDGALPCGNSIMAMNLIRLSRLCANEKYEDAANKIIESAAQLLNNQPSSCCGLLCSQLYLKNGGTEIILVNGDGFDTLKAGLPDCSQFTSAAVCGKSFEEIVSVAPYLRDYHSLDGKAAAYVCKKGSCHKAVTTPEMLKETLLTFNN